MLLRANNECVSADNFIEEFHFKMMDSSSEVIYQLSNFEFCLIWQSVVVSDFFSNLKLTLLSTFVL